MVSDAPTLELLCLRMLGKLKSTKSGFNPSRSWKAWSRQETPVRSLVTCTLALLDIRSIGEGRDLIPYPNFGVLVFAPNFRSAWKICGSCLKQRHPSRHARSQCVDKVKQTRNNQVLSCRCILTAFPPVQDLLQVCSPVVRDEVGSKIPGRACARNPTIGDPQEP